MPHKKITKTAYRVDAFRGKRKIGVLGIFRTKSDAQTSAGIEGTQMESHGVKFKTIPIKVIKRNLRRRK